MSPVRQPAAVSVQKKEWTCLRVLQVSELGLKLGEILTLVTQEIRM